MQKGREARLRAGLTVQDGGQGKSLGRRKGLSRTEAWTRAAGVRGVEGRGVSGDGWRRGTGRPEGRGGRQERLEGKVLGWSPSKTREAPDGQERSREGNHDERRAGRAQRPGRVLRTSRFL